MDFTNIINYVLDDLCVLITGGTRGIGFAIAQCLKASGAKVIITGTEMKPCTLTDFDYYKVDFFNLLEITNFKKILEQIKPDILINNAGINKIKVFEKINLDELCDIQKINVIAPFQLCQSAIIGMKEKKWGRIVNISSIWGINTKKGRGAYTISKFAINGLTKNLAIEMAPYNILVNSVAPGFTDTDMTRETLTITEMNKLASSVPIRRLAKPSEIAKLVAWLISRDNTYLTGQTIVIDGGYTSI